MIRLLDENEIKKTAFIDNRNVFAADLPANNKAQKKCMHGVHKGFCVILSWHFFPLHLVNYLH